MGVSGKKRGDRALGGAVSIKAFAGAVGVGAGWGITLRRARLAGVWASGGVTGGSLGIAANVLRERGKRPGEETPQVNLWR